MLGWVGGGGQLVSDAEEVEERCWRLRHRSTAPAAPSSPCCLSHNHHRRAVKLPAAPAAAPSVQPANGGTT